MPGVDGSALSLPVLVVSADERRRWSAAARRRAAVLRERPCLRDIEARERGGGLLHDRPRLRAVEHGGGLAERPPHGYRFRAVRRPPHACLDRGVTRARMDAARTRPSSSGTPVDLWSSSTACARLLRRRVASLKLDHRSQPHCAGAERRSFEGEGGASRRASCRWRAPFPPSSGRRAATSGRRAARGRFAGSAIAFGFVVAARPRSREIGAVVRRAFAWRWRSSCCEPLPTSAQRADERCEYFAATAKPSVRSGLSARTQFAPPRRRRFARPPPQKTRRSRARAHLESARRLGAVDVNARSSRSAATSAAATSGTGASACFLAAARGPPPAALATLLEHGADATARARRVGATRPARGGRRRPRRACRCSSTPRRGYDRRAAHQLTAKATPMVGVSAVRRADVAPAAGPTPLAAALATGALDCVRLCIDANADVERVGDSGLSPLAVAGAREMRVPRTAPARGGRRGEPGDG